jgi:hypothetical protein
MKSILWAFIFEWLIQWHLFHALEKSVIHLAGLKALGHHCRFLKKSFERRFFSRFFSKGAARRNTSFLYLEYFNDTAHLNVQIWTTS